MGKDKHTFKAVQITNPLAMAYVSPMVQAFAKKIDVAGITYESLITYFQQTAQLGGVGREFWVVTNEMNEMIAFANWYLCGLPHVGKVCCDYIYNFSKSQMPTKLLFEQFEVFAKRHRALLLSGFAMNETTFRYFRKIASRYKYDMLRSETVVFCARKKKEEANENIPENKD